MKKKYRTLGALLLIILCTFLMCLEVSAKGVKKSVPKNNSFKSYMDYRTITNCSSKQYKLQKKCKTAKNGLRTYKGRYVIALGTFYTNKVGTKVDLKMKNGSTVKCVVGDIKDNRHTDSTNRQARDGSVAEFIVDVTQLGNKSKRMGNVSYSDKKLLGSIKYIRVYG